MPGAVITVVQDRTVVLNKGYGVRDIATAKPVDPDNTRVRIGSTVSGHLKPRKSGLAS